MVVNAKVPKYILQGTNKGANVKQFARYDDQGTLIHSHDIQQGKIPLRHANSSVL